MKKIEYMVSWREWKGVEPCGKTEYYANSKTFTQMTEARAYFAEIKLRHYRVKFRKVTDELLGESE